MRERGFIPWNEPISDQGYKEILEKVDELYYKDHIQGSSDERGDDLFNKELSDYVSFRETMRKQHHEQIGYDPKHIKPRKTVLNRLKRWWVYLTT